MDKLQVQKLIDEIEKMKFHNRTIMTLLGFLHEEEMEKTTIYEVVVLFDLSKNDLRDLKKLIVDYDGNKFNFEQRALLINPVFKRENLIFIIESFINTDMFVKQGNLILADYAVKE